MIADDVLGLRRPPAKQAVDAKHPAHDRDRRGTPRHDLSDGEWHQGVAGSGTRGGAMLHIANVSIDCADLDRVATFWAAALCRCSC